MRAFVTGGTGFVGGRLAHALRERGNEVVALVRSPARAEALRALGCELVEGDVRDGAPIGRALEGCDAAFHVAAVYRVGIARRDREAMHETNVRGTRDVLDAARDARVERIVYVSTVNAFGDTGGRVVGRDLRAAPARTIRLLLRRDEVPRAQGRGEPRGGGSAARDRAARRHLRPGRHVADRRPDPPRPVGHPPVRELPDARLQRRSRGRRGRRPAPPARSRERYVLGGELTRMRELIAEAAAAAGRKPPRLAMPTPLVRLAAPLAPLLGPPLGLPPNLRELVRASDGVTYWATDAKARRELGYAPRDLATGMRDTWRATTSGQAPTLAG